MKASSHREEITLLLELSIQRPSESEFSELLQNISTHFDWTYFLERAISSNLAGYLLSHPIQAKAHFPAFVFEKIASYQQRIQMHSLQLLDLLKELVGLFEAHLIDYAVLKGCAGLLNQSFSFKTRQVSDIDILIDPSKQKEVYALLQTNGFQMSTSIYPTKWHQKHPTDHAPMHAHKNGKIVDIHIRLFPVHTGYQIDTFELLKNRQTVVFDQTQYTLLGSKEAELFNILHTHKHLYFGNMFKAGGLPDLHQMDFPTYIDLAQKWGATKQLAQMKDFWNSWLRREYNATFLGKTALRFIENRPFTQEEKLITLYRRVFKSQKNLLHPMRLYGKLFPSKAYLNCYFGEGSYLAAWLRRFWKMFKFG
jgi:hypothetical protein